MMGATREADVVVLDGLKAHHTSLQLWLLRLGRLNYEPAFCKGTKSEVPELRKLFREALQNIPIEVGLCWWTACD